MTSAPPPYTANQHQPQHIIITNQPTVSQPTVILQTIQVGPTPCLMACPHCRASITTTVDYEISGRTHLCALGLCLIGMWPCIPIPYLCCGGCCRRTVHTCPSCYTHIGSF